MWCFIRNSGGTGDSVRNRQVSRSFRFQGAIHLARITGGVLGTPGVEPVGRIQIDIHMLSSGFRFQRLEVTARNVSESAVGLDVLLDCHEQSDRGILGLGWPSECGFSREQHADLSRGELHRFDFVGDFAELRDTGCYEIDWWFTSELLGSGLNSTSVRVRSGPWIRYNQASQTAAQLFRVAGPTLPSDFGC